MPRLNESMHPVLKYESAIQAHGEHSLFSAIISLVLSLFLYFFLSHKYLILPVAQFPQVFFLLILIGTQLAPDAHLYKRWEDLR